MKELYSQSVWLSRIPYNVDCCQSNSSCILYNLITNSSHVFSYTSDPIFLFVSI